MGFTMDFLITSEELAALCGLPHIQQLAYLRGIRPYMDVKTSLVGVKDALAINQYQNNYTLNLIKGLKPKVSHAIRYDERYMV